MVKKKKKATGAARMRQLDYLPVQVWVKREALNRMTECAQERALPLARWLRMVAVQAANRRIRQKRKA